MTIAPVRFKKIEEHYWVTGILWLQTQFHRRSSRPDPSRTQFQSQMNIATQAHTWVESLWYWLSTWEATTPPAMATPCLKWDSWAKNFVLVILTRITAVFLVLRRWCSQRLPPPQSLHWLLTTYCTSICCCFPCCYGNCYHRLVSSNCAHGRRRTWNVDG